MRQGKIRLQLIQPEPKQLAKLNLACGQTAMPGFIGVDIVQLPSVDVVHDLTKIPWPFEDKSVEEVFCSHFYEHMNGQERIAFMDELWRTLILGGKVTIISPYYLSMRAVQDPTHCWPPVSEAQFLYFNRQWREQNGLNHYPIRCNFGFSYGYALTPDWANRSQEARDFAIRHYMNVVSDIHVTLTKEE